MVNSPSDAFVALRQLSLSYGQGDVSTPALKGVDVAIAKGEFASIVGPSGCGKSSLMKVVTGIMPPTEGEVWVNGAKVTGPLKIVGMAFQHPTLLPWRTALENVMLPLEVVEPHKHLIKKERGKYRQKALDILAAVGLAGFEDKLPRQLSGGMQQRVSLCRALIHDPQLLMLDEPFGALDAFTREELWDVLQNLWLDRKFTVILVTHDLREAVYLSDTVHVMSNRPGHIFASRVIPRTHLRTLDTTASTEFNEAVQELREHIWRLRTQ
ncbi:ABC transporter ATP-binding protein [Castellaniella sp.]|uniref:ABC transporter ATP-binding protein n=1 Tax=Castellaniella sp. TaxID=1955812 RepID=UPI0035622A42